MRVLEGGGRVCVCVGGGGGTDGTNVATEYIYNPGDVRVNDGLP